MSLNLQHTPLGMHETPFQLLREYPKDFLLSFVLGRISSPYRFGNIFASGALLSLGLSAPLS